MPTWRRTQSHDDGGVVTVKMEEGVGSGVGAGVGVASAGGGDGAGGGGGGGVEGVCGGDGDGLVGGGTLDDSGLGDRDFGGAPSSGAAAGSRFNPCAGGSTWAPRSRVEPLWVTREFGVDRGHVLDYAFEWSCLCLDVCWCVLMCAGVC